MAPTQPKVRSREDWADILDRIQTELGRTLAQTTEPTPLAPSSGPTDALRAPLEALDDRLSALQTSLKRAERCAAETDESLYFDAETMRLWTDTVKQLREKMAKCEAQANSVK